MFWVLSRAAPWAHWWEAHLVSPRWCPGSRPGAVRNGRTWRSVLPEPSLRSPHVLPFPGFGNLSRDQHGRHAGSGAPMLDGGTGGLWSSHGRELVRERPVALAGCPGVAGQQKLRGEALVREEQP